MVRFLLVGLLRPCVRLLLLKLIVRLFSRRMCRLLKVALNSCTMSLISRLNFVLLLIADRHSAYQADPLPTRQAWRFMLRRNCVTLKAGVEVDSFNE